MEEAKTYPEGHFVGLWMGICIAAFTAIWIPVSMALDVLGLMGVGPALGVAMGVAIGQAIENKHRRLGRIRPLTEAEKKRRTIAVGAGIAVMLLGVAVFVVLFLRATG